jgi:hypothetical protein
MMQDISSACFCLLMAPNDCNDHLEFILNLKNI